MFIWKCGLTFRYPSNSLASDVRELAWKNCSKISVRPTLELLWRKRGWINRKSKSQLIFKRNTAFWLPNMWCRGQHMAWAFYRAGEKGKGKRKSCSGVHKDTPGVLSWGIGSLLLPSVLTQLWGALWGQIRPLVGLRLVADALRRDEDISYLFVREWQRLVDNPLQVSILSSLSCGPLVG